MKARYATIVLIFVLGAARAALAEKRDIKAVDKKLDDAVKGFKATFKPGK